MNRLDQRRIAREKALRAAQIVSIAAALGGCGSESFVSQDASSDGSTQDIGTPSDAGVDTAPDVPVSDVAHDVLADSAPTDGGVQCPPELSGNACDNIGQYRTVESCCDESKGWFWSADTSECVSGCAIGPMVPPQLA